MTEQLQYAPLSSNEHLLDSAYVHHAWLRYAASSKLRIKMYEWLIIRKVKHLIALRLRASMTKCLSGH